MQELLDILEEEASILDPEADDMRRTLMSAHRKIAANGLSAVLTTQEKAAVKDALIDVGELYLFAGTSSGFDVDSKAQEREHRSRGAKARSQAAALGIYVRMS